MGVDKAGVAFGGRLLWEHQIETLRSTQPAELFISGRAEAAYVESGIEIIYDEAPKLGPLSGLVAGLRRCHSRWLLVLAIDLPRMPGEFLTRLAAKTGESGTGIVPSDGQRFHPLAAIYSRECLPLAEEALRSEDRSLQRFVLRAVKARLLTPFEILATEMSWFENVNTPEDLRRVENSESN